MPGALKVKFDNVWLTVTPYDCPGGGGLPEVSVKDSITVSPEGARRWLLVVVTVIVAFAVWLYVPPNGEGAGNARATAVTRSTGSRCFPKVETAAAALLRAS